MTRGEKLRAWHAALTPEEHRARCEKLRAGALRRWAAFTPEERSAMARKGLTRTPSETSREIAARRTPEERSAIARKGRATRRARELAKEESR